jgi:hypothetical protein
MIELKGKPKTDVLFKIDKNYVQVSYDKKGHLRLIRKAEKGQLSKARPSKDETVFSVTNFDNGESTLKSRGSHCGYFSVNGTVFWSTIWDDNDNPFFKKYSFHDWVQECAGVIANDKTGITRQDSTTSR